MSSGLFVKKYLDHFYQNRSGKYLSIDINESALKKYSFDDPISKNRGKLMANLRNKLKSFHGKLNSDYTAIIDSDVYFDFNISLYVCLWIIQNKSKSKKTFDPVTNFDKAFEKYIRSLIIKENKLLIQENGKKFRVINNYSS